MQFGKSLLYKTAKAHTLQAQSRYDGLSIEQMLIEFCVNVDLENCEDTELTQLIFNCYISDLDKELIETKNYKGLPLLCLVELCWKFSVPLCSVCAWLKSGIDYTSIYSMLITSTFKVRDEDVYHAPFECSVNKGYSVAKNNTKILRKKEYRYKGMRETTEFLFKDLKNQVDFSPACISWDDFFKFYNNNWKLINPSYKYRDSVIMKIYDTLRYSGCTRVQASQQLMHILSSGFTEWDIPMYYFEALTSDYKVMESCSIIGSGFLTASDIAFLCDYHYTDFKEFHRRVFTEGYLCNDYIEALNNGLRPNKFSCYLMGRVKYNRGVAFDIETSRLIKDISQYISTNENYTKNAYSSLINSLGFSTCFLVDKEY